MRASRWALRYYDPTGAVFTERRFRTRRRALGVLAAHHLYLLDIPSDGYTLRLERLGR